ncbi:MAG: trigger factor [Betaproteobacteria bacterium]|nr:trigger factor [Betaproteobacteria bacterium]
MQTSMENLSSLERRLSISVPQNEIEAEVETRLKRLARTVKLHGFRPGKVPFKIVAQTYGPQVRQEVLGDTVQRSFSEAVREQNLKVAGMPRFEAGSAESASGHFQYTATFEVYPEVVLADLSAAIVERPATQVTGQDVENTLEILRKQRVVFEPVERTAAGGDQAVISYVGTLEGKEFEGGKGTEVPVVLGEGRLLADFESQLTGMKSGDSKSFELTFPADYHGKDVAGKTAKFEVTVTRVAAPKLPELDAEFAKSLGIGDGDLGKMRGEVRANLERELKRRIESKVKEQVMDALLKSATVELPKALVEMEIGRLAQGARHDLEARGLKAEGLELPPQLFEEQAKRRVGLGLVIAELVKAHSLQAKPEQVRAVVEDFAQSYEQPTDVVRWYYSQPERLNEAEALVLEQNVVAWVLEKAKVVDKAVPFDDLMRK